ncbi:MAG: 5-(carboxyamino)imidazole ribonucleotide synthase [Francisellaceae bacterium]
MKKVKKMEKIKIAILGRGQLADMLKASVKEESPFEVRSFPLPEFLPVCEKQQIEHWRERLADFDVVSYEIENINPGLLSALGVQIKPAVEALAHAQDRLKEKRLFQALHINTNDFMAVDSIDMLKQAAEKLGLPFIVKTRQFGYDGKGQYIVKTVKDMDEAWRQLGSYALLAEAFVDFDYEVSQVATRDRFGHIAFYPLVTNVHREGILRETHVLDFNHRLVDQAQAAVTELMRHFNYIGSFAVEFFVKAGVLYANEMAPRVHNSGHWSIDGATVSQFRNHMLAIAGEAVEPVALKAPYVMMINLIGEDVPPDFKAEEGVFAHSYGKRPRAGRKLGHINVMADSLECFKSRIESVYNQLKADSIIKLKDRHE